MVDQMLEALLYAARRDESLKQALLASRSSKDAVADFAASLQARGFPLSPGELLAAGEEYADNLLKSCNGGAEYPIEGWEDAYEMFLAALL